MDGRRPSPFGASVSESAVGADDDWSDIYHNNDADKITAEDLVLLKYEAAWAMSMGMKLMYDAHDPGKALAKLRTANLDIESRLSVVRHSRSITADPSTDNDGPWDLRFPRKSDIQGSLLNLNGPNVAPPDVFHWGFLDRTCEVVERWHDGELTRLRSIAAALIQDEVAARFQTSEESRDAERKSAIGLLSSKDLHAHEVRGDRGFTLLHGIPTFCPGTRYPIVFEGDSDGDGHDELSDPPKFRVRDQLSKMVLYYVDDMDRTYLDDLRSSDQDSYLAARVVASGRNDIGLEGVDADEWEDLGAPSAGEDGVESKHAVDHIAYIIWLQDISHAGDRKLVEKYMNVHNSPGEIQNTLSPFRVKKHIHPMLELGMADQVDFSDRRTIHELNGWVADFLASYGVHT